MIYVTQIEPATGTALLDTNPIWTAGGVNYRVAGGYMATAPEGAITQDAEGDWSAPLALPTEGGVTVTTVAGVDWAQVMAALGLTRLDPVQINADPAEVIADRLPGIGSAKAAAIVAGRPWASTEDLAQLAGISPAMVAGWQISPGLAT